MIEFGTVAAFAVMGVVQGLTEFLPISSSAHVALTQRILRIAYPALTLQVWVHLATLVAVLLALRSSVSNITRSFIPGLSRGNGDTTGRRAEGRRWGLVLFVGSLPAVAVGLLVRNDMNAAFGNTRLMGYDLLITSLVLSLTRFFPGGTRPLTPGRGFLIGIAQAVAILPGVSRSGTTLTAGLALGLPAVEAARFSFLLSIPTIVGAVVLDASSLRHLGQAAVVPLIASFLASTGCGYLAIRIVWGLIQKGRLSYFAPYCALLGAIVILFGGS